MRVTIDKTDRQVIDALGEWLCKDMEKELRKNRIHDGPLSIAEISKMDKIHYVSERIRFYRDEII